MSPRKKSEETLVPEMEIEEVLDEAYDPRDEGSAPHKMPQA